MLLSRYFARAGPRKSRLKLDHREGLGLLVVVVVLVNYFFFHGQQFLNLIKKEQTENLKKENRQHIRIHLSENRDT